jgi:hypothetical protein
LVGQLVALCVGWFVYVCDLGGNGGGDFVATFVNN